MPIPQEINLDDYTSFVVTGVLYNTRKRFKNTYNSWQWASGVNLWRGSVWGIRKDTGKRQLLKRVYN